MTLELAQQIIFTCGVAIAVALTLAVVRFAWDMVANPNGGKGAGE